MASISPLSFLSSLNASAAAASSSNSPSSPMFPPSKSTNNPKRRQVAKVACNANIQNPNGGEQQPPQNNTNILGNNNNRRDVLIGLGGLSAASLAYNPFAAAAPVAPDLSTCGNPTLPAGAKPTKCCPPYSTKIVDFTFPTNQPLRIREPAHELSSETLTKYKNALKLMKALPDDDPRSFTQQANVHCAYCHNSYHQVGYPDLDLQVHFSWIFFPFHRWYMYFYERILGSLINDPTFALPFWNWDTPAGMEIPEIYTDRKSPLYNALRNANHQPPVLVDLNWNKKDVDTSGNIDANLKIMYRQVSEAATPICFFGKPFRAGDIAYTSKNNGAGSLEVQPHNTVHSWTGDGTQPNRENMGSLYSAARDPIFYSHHSNVDRMWSIWKSFGREDLDDSDYLESSFLFYDENKNLVRVKTKDCLDTRKLGYDFKDVPIPWRDAKPLPRRTKAQRLAGKPLTKTSVAFPFTLNKIVSTVVKKPKDTVKDEALLIEIQFDRRKEVKFDVLINEEEDATLANPLNREFAGSFVNVSHTQTSTDMTTDLIYSIGIGNLLKDLEAEGDDSVVVTLVPQYGDGVIIKDIKIAPCSA